MNDSGTDKIDLLIVDDHVMFREGLARSLEKDICDSPADWLWLQKKWKYDKAASS